MGQVVQVPATGPHQGILWREDCRLLCLAGLVRLTKITVLVNLTFRLLYRLVAARGPGRPGGFPLRSLHPRPQRQRPGGLQREG